MANGEPSETQKRRAELLEETSSIKLGIKIHNQRSMEDFPRCGTIPGKLVKVTAGWRLDLFRCDRNSVCTLSDPLCTVNCTSYCVPLASCNAKAPCATGYTCNARNSQP